MPAIVVPLSLDVHDRGYSPLSDGENNRLALFIRSCTFVHVVKNLERFMQKTQKKTRRLPSAAAVSFDSDKLLSRREAACNRAGPRSINKEVSHAVKT